MSSNGRLAPAELANIYDGGGHVVGQLRKDAAAAWNAMCDEAKRSGMPVPIPDGPDSSYRTFARQVYWRNYWCGRGQCANAAEPGSSNHGLGIAVDCSHSDKSRNRWVVDKIGAKYGWGSKGSDAPWEEWHMKWQAVTPWWTKVIVLKFLPLHTGLKGLRRVSTGPNVYGLSKRLQTCGYLKQRTSAYTYAVEHAVKAFQGNHHLAIDGVTGQATWTAVKASADRCSKTHKKEWTKAPF